MRRLRSRRPRLRTSLAENVDAPRYLEVRAGLRTDLRSGDRCGVIWGTPERLTRSRAGRGTRCVPPVARRLRHLARTRGTWRPRLQVEHLFALGHRRIAFAGSRDPRLADLVGTRRATFEHAAAALGLEPVLAADFDSTDASVPELIAGLRGAGVTAVAADNGDIAATTVGAALRLGLRVPDDLAVIGYDDTPLATMIEPQLSTVRIDTAGLGRYSAALAISAATGRPAPEVGPEFTSELIVRASTDPSARGASDGAPAG